VLLLPLLLLGPQVFVEQCRELDIAIAAPSAGAASLARQALLRQQAAAAAATGSSGNLAGSSSGSGKGSAGNLAGQVGGWVGGGGQEELQLGSWGWQGQHGLPAAPALQHWLVCCIAECSMCRCC
jgi:hypothetical protein